MKPKYWMSLLVVVFLVLTGCGRSAPPPIAPGLAGGDAVESEASEPMRSSAVSGAEESFSSAGNPAPDRMVIQNATLELVVADTGKTEGEVGTLVNELKGYILSSERYQYGEGLFQIQLTLRIPAERFNEVLTRLRAMALDVRRESISSQDVTQEYVDLQSRLRALETKAERLEQLMADAEDTEAVLSVYRELSATQVEIEQTKGRMQYLENAAALATIAVQLTPDAMARPIEVPGWSPSSTVNRALEALLNFLKFLADAAIWFGLLLLPALLVAGVIVWVGLRLAALIFRRRPARPEVRPAPPAGPPPAPSA